jgi:DNA-directed RNA polymerase alpha subunit
MTRQDIELRDAIAMKAMHALLTRPIAELAQGATSSTNATVREYVSEAAYKIADTMMEIRAKKDVVSIDELNLTLRTSCALKESGIKTLDQLTACTYSQVLKMSNIGRKSLNEIKDVLASLGHSLKD